jgi:two-component system, OmpR family, response regulator RpaA
MTMTYTTTEVARLCEVCTRTVCKWVDTGLLVGHRIPGSRHRRVRRADLERFAADHGLTLAEPVAAAEANPAGGAS